MAIKSPKTMTDNTPAKTELAALAEQINDAHRQAEEHARSAIEHAIAAGRLLLEAKEKTPHGGWLPWVRENCKFAVRTSQAYMRVASNTQRVAHLPLRDALKLLAEPKAAAQPGAPVVEDDEIRKLLPRLNKDDRDGLRQSIESLGCHTPVLVTAGTRIVFDGFERLDICRELGLPYEIREIDTATTREDAARQRFATQMCRANYTEYQRAAILAGILGYIEKHPGEHL